MQLAPRWRHLTCSGNRPPAGCVEQAKSATTSGPRWSAQCAHDFLRRSKGRQRDRLLQCPVHALEAVRRRGKRWIIAHTRSQGANQISTITHPRNSAPTWPAPSEVASFNIALTIVSSHPSPTTIEQTAHHGRNVGRAARRLSTTSVRTERPTEPAWESTSPLAQQFPQLRVGRSVRTRRM